MGATRKTGNLNGCSRGSVAELEAAGVALIHDPHGDFRGQIRIHENHVAEFKASGLYDRLQTVEREIHLCPRIFWNLTTLGISASHAGDEQEIVGEDTRRCSTRGWVTFGRDGRSEERR